MGSEMCIRDRYDDNAPQSEEPIISATAIPVASLEESRPVNAPQPFPTGEEEESSVDGGEDEHPEMEEDCDEFTSSSALRPSKHEIAEVNSLDVLPQARK